MENLKRYKTFDCPECGGGGLTEDKDGPLVLFSDVVAQNSTSTNKQSDAIPLWRIRDVLQGHFDYNTVNVVMDDME